MATRRSKYSQTGDLNLKEGAIFSRSLNDNRRMIVTGLYFIRFSSQNVCFNNVYSNKKNRHKPEPNRNLEKTNRTVNSGLNILRKLRDILIMVFKSIVQPYFDYCAQVWGSLGRTSNKLQRFAFRLHSFKAMFGQMKY